MWKLINWIGAVAATILGAILGGEYKNPLHLIALVSIISYAVTVNILINKNDEKDKKLADLEEESARAKNQLSQILFQSNQNGENRLYLAVHPNINGKISANLTIPVQVIMNAPFCIDPPPDIKLLAKKKLASVVVCGSTIYPKEFGAEWEYIIKTDHFKNMSICSDKFFSGLIEITFSQAGTYEYILEAKSKEFHSRISNSFEVA